MSDISKKIKDHSIEIVYSLIILTWFFISFILKDAFVIQPMKISISFNELFGTENSWLFFLSLFIYIVPIISIVRIVAIFLEDKLGIIFKADSFIGIIANFVNSTFILVIISLFILKEASNIKYFASINIFTYCIFLLSLGINIMQVFLLISKLKRMSASYNAYLAYKKTLKEQNKKKKKKDKVTRISIQRKLLFSIISTIFLIIVLLSFILMSDYRSTILSSVIANGTTLADQCASVVKENIIGNSKKIRIFLGREAEKNEDSKFKFTSLSFYQYDKATDEYLLDKDEADILSTSKDLAGSQLSEEYKNIEENTYRYEKANKSYKIFVPVVIQEKKIGFSVIEYHEDVIYESYFRTQIRIILFSALVLYLAIVLIYLIGDNIIRPLLYLQMGVKKIATNLGNMIKGKEKISSARLTYTDTVKTKDEIKDLSLAVAEMSNVISGVVPYISASTFKHADKKKATSSKRDLTFLFTDIRGFTTLCEGKSPEAVVNILNSYLELQTKIIKKNNGEIDKFVGDEVMAMFDGPEKELNACKTSMEIREAMQKEKEKRETTGEATVNIGIGVNTGIVVFGSVGASDRMDFTSIGDNVNLAARLEGANKPYKSKTLISESVYKKVEKQFLCRQIDLMTVKGKVKPVKIYEVLQATSKASKKVKEIKILFENGLKEYRKKNWVEAMKYFTANIKRYHDGPSEVFLERCRLFKRNPPPDNWNGIFRLTAK